MSINSVLLFDYGTIKNNTKLSYVLGTFIRSWHVLNIKTSICINSFSPGLRTYMPVSEGVGGQTEIVLNK